MDPLAATTLQQLRIAAGYSKRRLSKRLGVDCSTVAHWEMGKRKPELRYVRQLSDIFGRELLFLVEVLWGERVDDPCPCGCGGKKSLPDNDNASQLHIAVRCQGEGCDRVKMYLPTRKHPKFCERCRYKNGSMRSILFPDRTVVEVARQLKAQHRHIRTYEDGRVIPTWKTIQKLGELKGDLDEVIRFFERLNPNPTRTPIHKTFFCVSHEHHGARAPHAPLCPLKRDLVKSDIDYQLKISGGRTEEEANSGPWQKPFIDPNTGRCRSIHCSSASFHIYLKDQKLKELIGEGTIESHKEWQKVWSENREYLRWNNLKPSKKGEGLQPSKKEWRRVAVKVRRHQVRCRKAAISRLIQTWLKPHYQFNLCNCCQHLIGSADREPLRRRRQTLPNACRQCYLRLCDHVPLGPANVSSQDLGKYVQWTVLHYLDPENFSFRKIAEQLCPYCVLLFASPDLLKNHIEHHGDQIEQSRRSATMVMKKVAYVIDRLRDPTKLFKEFRNTARLILEAKENQTIEKSLVKQSKRSGFTPLRDKVSLLK